MSFWKTELLELLRQRALIKGENIRLASGRESNVYVDSKKLSLHGPSLKILSSAFLNVIEKNFSKINFIAGVSVGGDPLVAGVLLEAHHTHPEWSGLLVRKEPKSHGKSQGKSVEGLTATENSRTCVLLEDVLSTGGSAIRAIEALRQEGYDVVGLIVIVDREMGAPEKISQNFGVPVFSLCQLSEFSFS